MPHSLQRRGRGSEATAGDAPKVQRKNQMQEEIRQEETGLRRHVRARIPAYLATLIGGVVAMGVNAPLTSPDDLVGNAGSVAFVSLIGAVIAGMIWARLRGDVQSRSRTFNVILTVLLILVVIAAAVIEFVGEISNAIRYIIPLGAVMTIFTSVLTPVFERWKDSRGIIWIALLFPIAMLAIGYWLTSNEFGFTEAPSLSLPPPPA